MNLVLWFSGIILGCVGLATLWSPYSSQIAGLLLFFAGFFLIPPIWKMICRTLPFHIPSYVRVIICLLLFFVGARFERAKLPESFTQSKVQNMTSSSNKNKDIDAIAKAGAIETEKISNPSVSPAASPSLEPQTSQEPIEAHSDLPYPIKFDELPNNWKNGEIWHNIAIEPNTTDDELLGLAKRLHQDFPDWKFRIFDDGNATMIKKYIAWDENYPNESKYPYPEPWANKHYIGIINDMLNFETRSKEWKLVLDSGRDYSL